ncbi:MAG: GGDEF domain-containing protein [Actinomycetota bacterium]|nr:GGDEF domain-containing protein [Actinomycetota bacterium]
MGIACWDGFESPKRLTERADRALYEANRTGRDQGGSCRINENRRTARTL